MLKNNYSMGHWFGDFLMLKRRHYFKVEGREFLKVKFLKVRNQGISHIDEYLSRTFIS